MSKEDVDSELNNIVALCWDLDNANAPLSPSDCRGIAKSICDCVGRTRSILDADSAKDLDAKRAILQEAHSILQDVKNIRRIMGKLDQ